MLCLYSYRIGDKEFGRYQSEVEDFKKLFKKLVRKLDDVVVELKNGDVWIFYKINNSHKFTRLQIFILHIIL